jgi:hypothetical protein
MRRGWVLVALAATALLLIPARARGAGTPQVLATSRYARVLGEAPARPLAAEVATFVDAAVPRAAALTGATDLSPIPTTVYRTRPEFLRATELPDWSTIVGLATFPQGVIHVDGTGLLASVRRVTAHEVGHIMEARRLGATYPELPLWANEGIAEYLAGGEAAYQDPNAVAAVAQGKALPVANLEAAFRDEDTVGSAYAESASLITFLVAQKGPEVISSLLARVAEEGAFPKALKEVTGLTEAELDAAWQDSLRGRWGWIPFLDLNALIWMVMVVLLLIALLRQLRERRRARDNETEDAARD